MSKTALIGLAGWLVVIVSTSGSMGGSVAPHDWVQLTGSRTPVFPCHQPISMAYDPPLNKAVALGPSGSCVHKSYTYSTYGFNGTTWARLSPSTPFQPSGNATSSTVYPSGENMVYVPTSHYLVYPALNGTPNQAGGISSSIEFFQFRNLTWQPLPNGSSPFAFQPGVNAFNFNVAWDPDVSGILLYGTWYAYNGVGSLVPVSNVTWSFASGKWTNLTTAPNPGEFQGQGMAYLPGFGVVVSGTFTKSTWAFANGSWTNKGGGPKAFASSSSYDPRLGKIVMIRECKFAHPFLQSCTSTYNGRSWNTIPCPTACPNYKSDVKSETTYDAQLGGVLLLDTVNTANATGIPATFLFA